VQNPGESLANLRHFFYPAILHIAGCRIGCKTVHYFIMETGLERGGRGGQRKTGKVGVVTEYPAALIEGQP